MSVLNDRFGIPALQGQLQAGDSELELTNSTKVKVGETVCFGKGNRLE